MANHNSMGAEGRDDRDLRDDAPTPSQQGSSGGEIATRIGADDEEAAALGESIHPGRIHGADKVQPNRPGHGGHGAQND